MLKTELLKAVLMITQLLKRGSTKNFKVNMMLWKINMK